MRDGTSRRIRFPASLTAALRSGQLVVFAGAGVSMGEPACLPNFTSLANTIAEGTGVTLAEGEPVDGFLGKLQRRGVEVHDLAARALRRDGLAPTELHRNLLRLYTDAGQVRIVTTNFDLLFEQAAEHLFDTPPEAFRAPALPLGHAFKGIVHVHGAVSQPMNTVLTDTDFGRAYLTEGWARRFLVELYREFTVLFVGYGHNDTVMNYLSRALPERQASRRFALTAEADSQRWRVLGVEPIPYPQANAYDHTALYQGVDRLASYMSRGVLDWQREITELAGKPPPLDPDDIEMVEEALKEAVTTRFFTRAASSPGWIDWLDRRDQLRTLFSFSDEALGEGEERLSERDSELAAWLSEKFADDHAGTLFQLIAHHGMRLHPAFWWLLGHHVALSDRNLPNTEILSRWVSLLIATAPRSGRSGYVLLWLGKRCMKHEMNDDLLFIFDALAKSRLVLKSSSLSSADDRNAGRASICSEPKLVGDHYQLNELWKSLQLSLVHVAEPLLDRITRRLEERRLILRTWLPLGSTWDQTSFSRSAIEPHEQDRHPKAVDVLIDAVRDCLEWLAVNNTAAAGRWCDRLADSDVPLLRRLAVHTLYRRPDLSSDDKIDSLLTQIDIHDVAARHEIFQAVQQAYRGASQGRRRRLIDAVLAYRGTDEENPAEDKHTSRQHYDWLAWIHKSVPDCELATNAFDRVQAQYSKWQPREHADLTHWIGSGWGSPHQSPWTVEALLERPPSESWSELLSFKQTEIDGPERLGLLSVVEDAAKENFGWGNGLAEVLAGAGNWDVDLWPALIRAWSTTELDESGHRTVLARLGSVELHTKHADSIADGLRALVRDGGKPYALNVLPQANAIALDLWHRLEQRDEQEAGGDWLQMAINCPAGRLAEYWFHSLSIWRRQQEPGLAALPDEYRGALSEIIHDRSLSGRLGRAVIASQFSFLAALDEDWTRENVRPLFFAGSEIGDFEAAWDGFLTWGRLGPTTAKLLSDAFVKAVPRIAADPSSHRHRFIGHYLTMVGYFVDDPLDTWIPRLFDHGGDEIRKEFAAEIGDHVRTMDDSQIEQWWKRWLRDYWRGRLAGKPKPLEAAEIEIMVEWLPDLAAVFSEAVELAIQMSSVPLGHGMLIHEIAQEEIWREHPIEVAKLLIHVGESDSPHYVWDGGLELITHVRETDLPPDLDRGLEELVARLGLAKG